MAEALALSRDAFAQRRFEMVSARDGTPGSRHLDDARVVTIRHVPASVGAREALAAARLPWIDATNEMHAEGERIAARRHPEEMIVLARDDAVVAPLLQALAGGKVTDAFAVDLSHGMAVIELTGPRIDDWLSHLVDASAIPRAGACSRCRLADVAVFLARWSVDRLWLVADRSLSPYLAHWLAFAHEGAFEPA